MANIIEYLNKFMNAKYGKDVKKDFYDCVNEINNEVTDTTARQDLLERKYDEQIENIASGEYQNAEIVEARQGYSTLGAIIKKKVFHFDNVQDMKNCLTLQIGDVVQTLGYYTKNDGGAGLYKIIAAPLSSIDEGSTIALNNNFIAQLISKGSINAKQFGAYGDGEHDDTQAIQNAIDYLNGFINCDSVCLNPVELALKTGIYKITSKIIMPPYIKLKCNASVFESCVDDDATLAIKYTKTLKIGDRTKYYINKTSFLNGEIISGGLTIYYKGDAYFGDEENVNVGLEVGNDDNTYDDELSRCRISDVNVYNFSTGLLINRINTYLIDFNHFHLEHNYIDIKIGKGDFASMTNAGENVTFTKCTIAGAVYGYYLNSRDYFSVGFNDCSFDFNSCDFYFPSYTNTQTNVFGGHIESVGYNNEYLPDIDKNTLPAFGTIGYYAGENYPNGFVSLQFFGTWIQIRATDYKTARFKSVAMDNFGVAFNNTRLMMNSKCNVDETFFCDENVFIINSAFDLFVDHKLSRNRILLSKRLETFTLDDLTNLSAEVSDVKSGYRIGNAPQANLWSIVEDRCFSSKSLCFAPTATAKNFMLYRKMHTNGHRNLLVSPVVKSSIMQDLEFSINYVFYDRNGNELLRRDVSADASVKFSDAQNNVWNKASSAYAIEIPLQCDYVDISIYGQKKDRTEFGLKNNIYINGLYMNMFN